MGRSPPPIAAPATSVLSGRGPWRRPYASTRTTMLQLLALPPPRTCAAARHISCGLSVGYVRTYASIQTSTKATEEGTTRSDRSID